MATRDPSKCEEILVLQRVRRCGPSVVLASVAIVATHRLSWRSGVTTAEALGPLPGDDLIPRPMLQWTRGITIEAPPDEIWPWLVQMGYHRGGWYTNERIDRLIWRVDARNADRVLPEYQSLKVNDIVPDGPDHAAYFRVRRLEPHRWLVYHSIRHPYRGHPVDPNDEEALRRVEESLIQGGTYIDFTWAFVLEPSSPGTSRLLIRTRAVVAPKTVRFVMVPFGLIDAFFAHMILRGVRRRAENRSLPPSPPQDRDS